MKITFSILPFDEEHQKIYCKMRLEAYGFFAISENIKESVYSSLFKERSLLPIGLFLNEELDAICYVSNRYHTLFIEQLFVRKKMQGTHLHLGQMLLQYILENKKFFEAYFEETFTFSRLNAVDHKSKAIYELYGFKEKGNYFHLEKPI